MFVGMALTDGNLLLNSDGSSWRPNVHIDDICKVLALVIEKSFDNFEVINVGSNNLNCQVTDVIDILKQKLPGLKAEFTGTKHDLFKDQYVVGGKDKRSYKVDFSKLDTIFGEKVTLNLAHTEDDEEEDEDENDDCKLCHLSLSDKDDDEDKDKEPVTFKWSDLKQGNTVAILYAEKKVFYLHVIIMGYIF
jgi:dTDP-D-glucose 4,6-dehydratase